MKQTMFLVVAIAVLFFVAGGFVYSNYRDNMLSATDTPLANKKETGSGHGQVIDFEVNEDPIPGDNVVAPKYNNIHNGYKTRAQSYLDGDIILSHPVQVNTDALIFRVTKDEVSEERFRVDTEGRLYIKGVLVDRMDIPEIRDSLREIANAFSNKCDCSGRLP